MSESDTDNIIQDLKSKPQIAIKGNTSDFLKKFSKQQADEGKPSSTNVGDPMLGMKQEESEPSDYEAEQESYSVNKEDITSDRKGKKKGFVERQIEENRKLKEELENIVKRKSQNLKPKSKNLKDSHLKVKQQQKRITTNNNLGKPVKRKKNSKGSCQNKSTTCAENWTFTTSPAIQSSKRTTLNPSSKLMTLLKSCLTMIQRFFLCTPELQQQMPPCTMRHPKKTSGQQKPQGTKRSTKSRTRYRNSSSTNSRSKSTASLKQPKPTTTPCLTLNKQSKTSFKQQSNVNKMDATSSLMSGKVVTKQLKKK